MQFILRLNDGPPWEIPGNSDSAKADQGFNLIRTYIDLMRQAEPPVTEFNISVEIRL